MPTSYSFNASASSKDDLKDQVATEFDRLAEGSDGNFDPATAKEVTNAIIDINREPEGDEVIVAALSGSFRDEADDETLRQGTACNVSVSYLAKGANN